MSDSRKSRHYTTRFEDISTIAATHYLSYDLARMFLGNKIGQGASRDVYVFDMIPNSVIKISDSFYDDNIMEWHVWQWVSDQPKYSKWFAPCLWCSPGGHFLIQKRTKPLPEKYKMPKEVPAIFTDLKRTNWGLLNGKLVCHDYGFLRRGIDVMMDAKRLAVWDRGISELRVKK